MHHDDPMLFAYQDKFWLYYKCAGWQESATKRGHRKKYAGSDIRWGVAVSDEITESYHYSEFKRYPNFLEDNFLSGL